ncbi:MAG: GxxExxY protein [Desulfuromonadaceae bacterium]|nr:GxxExxY protein [Desulfuromonadaceae bacterium]MDD2734418.1 GxxExxY protein [Desulfuromonadaceae bacterium]
MRDSELTEVIIGAAIDVHKVLGPGLLESAYEECFCHELTLRGVFFERQKPLSLSYKGLKLDCGYRMDVVVDNRVVVELKSMERVLSIHEAQLLTYLKLSGLRTGLMFNFNVQVLKEGLKRMVL